MTRLQELQQRFQDYLIDVSNEIEKDIVSSESALAEHRLGTYYNAYRIRLIDILAVDYAAIEKYIGREAFEDLALDYLKAYPSAHPSVRWFGQHLSDYLDNQAGQKGDAFLAEMALFEWNRGLVFDNEDAKTIFHIDNMAQVPPEAWPELRIEFIPAMHWIDLHWNVAPCSAALDNNEPPPEKHRDDIPTRWLIWRKNRNPNWRSLEVHEAWAIEFAQQGTSFAELCEGLREWITEDQIAITAAGFLKQWIHDEMVIISRHNACQ